MMEIFKYLVEEKFDDFLSFLDQESLEERDTEGCSLLHTAVQCNNSQAVDTLITYGADINAKDNKGNTPLHLAAVLDLPEIFQLLLDGGADHTLRNNSQRTPENLAGRKTSQILERYLSDYGYTEKIPRHKKRIMD